MRIEIRTCFAVVASVPRAAGAREAVDPVRASATVLARGRGTVVCVYGAGVAFETRLTNAPNPKGWVIKREENMEFNLLLCAAYIDKRTFYISPFWTGMLMERETHVNFYLMVQFWPKIAMFISGISLWRSNEILNTL